MPEYKVIQMINELKELTATEPSTGAISTGMQSVSGALERDNSSNIVIRKPSKGWFLQAETKAEAMKILQDALGKLKTVTSRESVFFSLRSSVPHVLQILFSADSFTAF
jgi:hypothetical protein